MRCRLSTTPKPHFLADAVAGLGATRGVAFVLVVERDGLLLKPDIARTLDVAAMNIVRLFLPAFTARMHAGRIEVELPVAPMSSSPQRGRPRLISD